MAYAKKITREYLEKLGVKEVFPILGRCAMDTWKEGFRFKAAQFDGHYYIMQLYDPEVRQQTPLEERNYSHGEIFIPFHRLVYAWVYGEVPEGMIVDHIDDDKTNNDPKNLQLLTPSQNIWKNRPGVNTREVKCSLRRPLSYYETELEIAEEEYAEAKLRKDTKKVHTLRTLISYRRAQIRYYKNHQEAE